VVRPVPIEPTRSSRKANTTASKRQEWFSIRTIFRSEYPDDERAEPLYEERIVLMRAKSLEHVQERIQQYSVTSREELVNALGGRVISTLYEVLDIVELSAERIVDGTEVYYRFLKPTGLDHLRRSLLFDDTGAGTSTAG